MRDHGVSQMASSPTKSSLPLDRVLSLEIARVTERAAVAAARLRGRGNEKAADQAAVDAMRREMNSLAIAGTVVIGEGERDEAPMLFIGEKVGSGQGPRVDIAVDPLEGTTLCAEKHARRDRHDGDGRRRLAAQCSRRLYGEDRHRSRLPAGRVDLDVPRRRTSVRSPRRKA